MKICCAGHDLVAFGAARCPLCEHIRTTDKYTLQLEAHIEELNNKINKLINEKVSNLKENWNGGAT